MAVKTGMIRRRHGGDQYRLQAVVVTIVFAFLSPGGAGLAAPLGPEEHPAGRAVALGGGSYRVTASVFAEGTDGQVGTQASSGHWIRASDNLVALPACTESSCPWVPTGTGPEGRYGPQTTCAEDDGLCWVKIVSDTTGLCTVAPVHDRGPVRHRHDDTVDAVQESEGGAILDFETKARRTCPAGQFALGTYGRPK